MTPEEDEVLLEESEGLALQLQKEMQLIDMIFEVMLLLEILVDVVTFVDLWNDDDDFDAGTIGGKGLVNAGFNLYYLARDNFLPKPEPEVVVEVNIEVEVDM